MALDQNDRRAASRGMLSSGNTNADTAKLATDYASQKYGNYVAGLQPFTAVPGQALGVASGQAGVQTGQGSQLNQSYGTQADLFNKAQLGIGNANASADLASLNASGNLLNAIMNIGKLGVSGGGSLGGNALSGLGSSLGSLGSGLMSVLGFSDENLKDNIEEIGELHDGQKVVRWTYKGMPGHTHVGLIAQDVENVVPEAVGELGGFKTVDYKKATDFAADFGRFKEAA